jgi:hypothetical protein
MLWTPAKAPHCKYDIAAEVLLQAFLISRNEEKWVVSLGYLQFYSRVHILAVPLYSPAIWKNRPHVQSSGQSSWLHNGVVFCFLWGTNWIYICYVEESRPPLWSSGQSFWLHNGDVLCFPWGTNWIYICYAKESRQPLWCSGQSSWLQIQKFAFDSRRYQIS